MNKNKSVEKDSKRRISSHDSVITISSSDSGFETNDRDKMSFKLRSYIKEKRRVKLWGIEFNHFIKSGDPNIFVVLGGTQFSIYECSMNGPIKLRQCYEDPDRKEDFYTCCWTVNEESQRSILLTAGYRGIIRIMEPDSIDLSARHLIGHGGAVNQLKISPRMPFLLASASSDHSFRLWNIETATCIATFHGENAHRDQVITIDFNHDCSKIVSGGIDHVLAIWDLTTPELKNGIESSRLYDERKSETSFKTLLECFPVFRSRHIHSNYIDCVQWFGDYILSKSNENDLYCWKPGLWKCDDDIPIKSKDCFKIVANFDIENCDYFFIRFETTWDRSFLACGNGVGEIFIWNLSSSDPDHIPRIKLTHPKRKEAVRQLSFSRCGRELIFCCDDGTIWHYHR